MPRSALLPILAALLASGAAAQPRSMAQHPRLAPVRPQTGVLGAYEAQMKRVFREAFDARVRLLAIVQRSFDTEYAVGLRQDGARYEIFALRPSRQVWAYQAIKLYRSGRAGVMILDDPKRDKGRKGGRGAELIDSGPELRDGTDDEVARLEKDLPADPADLPLARCAVPVDDAAAAGVTAAWRSMLEAVRPDEDLMPGIDGTSYLFSMEADGRALAGETWTPRPGTRPAKLASLAEAMREYCETRAAGHLEEIAKLARELGGTR